MIGRADERAWIGRLIEGARAGRSGALVLHGEPGVGKSVLLDWAVEAAAGMRVLRATGVETEVNLAFAGLDQLARPVLPLAGRLPTRQCQALLGALGLAGDPGPDRFLVAAATLSLLSEAAEDRAVVCVVEDAHWLDPPSSEALAFAARRLEAERVVLIAATRDEPWPGLPALPIGGLDHEDAVALLGEHAAQIASEVRDRLIEETGGNALALVELAGSLTPQQLTGVEPLPRQLPLNARIQKAFLARVRRLPEASRTLLLVAAADDTADPALVFRAGRELGVAPDALEPAERAGLLTVDGSGRLSFRHPLVREAVYQGATFIGRTAVHRALADALDRDDQAGRRVWHLAATVIGPDEHVAGLLELSGELARQRGGYAVAAAAFERAAELSTARSDRGRHIIAAAQAAFQAGQGDRASALVDRADSQATEVTLLKGRIEFARGSAVTAHALLFGAAQRMAERDQRGAAAVLVEAARAAWNANDPGHLAEATQLLGTLELSAADPLTPVVSATLALADLNAGRTRNAITRITRETDRWLRLTANMHDERFAEASLALAGVSRLTADDQAGLALGTSVVAGCRTRGLAAWLPWALINLSMTEAFAGQHSAAVATATEGLQLARDLAQPAAICGGASILAWLAAVRGEAERCRQLTADAVQLAEQHQLAAISVVATWALGLLELPLGHPKRALDRLLDQTHGPLVVPTVKCLITPDLVEAAVRAGRTDGLEEFLAWYEEWASATGQRTAEALVHRCKALLADHDAEEHFTQALRLHAHAGPDHRPFDRARTQLLYGQWLRRTRRRADARVHLKPAHETFERLGATPWADRANTELRATGQTARKPTSVRPRLTPQEMQVIRLVAEGNSNREVAAQLFLSPRTVAYHLYKAYPKLGVTSRAELTRLDLDTLLAASEQATDTTH